VLVPSSTCQVVAVPFGLTVPVTVAVVGPTELTGPVVALGAVAAVAATRRATSCRVIRAECYRRDGVRLAVLRSFYIVGGP
jgi:hypothetical protein